MDSDTDFFDIRSVTGDRSVASVVCAGGFGVVQLILSSFKQGLVLKTALSRVG